MNRNPYSLLFGKEPSQLISKATQITVVTESFHNTISPQQVYIITGVRGSGKTVMMTAYKMDPTEESFGSFIDKHATEEYKTWLKTEQKRRAEAYN